MGIRSRASAIWVGMGSHRRADARPSGSSPRRSIAWMLEALALWMWHVPVLYQATLTVRLDPCSAAPQLLPHGRAVLVGTVWCGAFGDELRCSDVLHIRNRGALQRSRCLLTFSSVLWYPAYADHNSALGLTPLQDQQLGGVIMWVPSGVVFIVIGLALFAKWLSESDRRLKLGSLEAVLQQGERS